jgi:hypothetical protein
MKLGQPPFVVDIVLDQDTPAQVGSMLTGRVMLPPEALTEKAALKSIKVLFQGQEKTKVTYKRTSHDIDENNTTHTYTVKEIKPVCSHVLLEEEYEKGQKKRSTVPFSFQLPSHLPVSAKLGFPDMKYGLIIKKKFDYAVLSYMVKVDIQRRGLLKGTLTYEKEVKVVPRQSTSITMGTPWEVIPTIQTPHKGWFRRVKGKDKLYLAARLPHGNHYECGHNITVDLSVLNLSKKVVIEKVEVTLNERGRWTAKGHEQKLETLPVTKTFGWLGDAVMTPSPESAVQESNGSQLETQMRNELLQGAHRQILTIPSTCQPDFSLQLMRCTHVLSINVKSNQWRPPTLEIPIVLHPASSPSPSPSFQPHSVPAMTIAGTSIGTEVPMSTTSSVECLPVAVAQAVPVAVQGSLVPQYGHSSMTNDEIHNVIHQNVQCDGCKQYPLRGVRYRCAHQNHDYCHKCSQLHDGLCIIDRTQLSVCQENAPNIAPSVTVAAAVAPTTTTTSMTTPLAPSVPQSQGLHPAIEAQVGSLAIWEDSPIPPDTGMGAWFAKQAVRHTMGVDLSAPMARQVPLVPFTPVPYIPPEHVSVAALCAHVQVHPDPVSCITQFLQQQPSGLVWVKLVSNLTPTEFGEIIGTVPELYRQSPVAEKLVPMVRPFTTEHLIKALQAAKCSGVRQRMLLSLTAYCVDKTKESNRKMKAELTDIEQAFYRRGIGYGRLCG